MSDQKWANDALQFPRLIAEISATQDIDLESLANEMDLEISEVEDLFDRADEAWNKIKAGETSVTIPLHVLEMLVKYAKPAIENDADECNEKGLVATEEMADEFEAIDIAERTLHSMSENLSKPAI